MNQNNDKQTTTSESKRSYKLYAKCDNLRHLNVSVSATPESKPYAIIRSKRKSSNYALTFNRTEENNQVQQANLELEQIKGTSTWRIKSNSNNNSLQSTYVNIGTNMTIIKHNSKTYGIYRSPKRSNVLVVIKDSNIVGFITQNSPSIFKSSYDLKLKSSLPNVLPPIFLFAILKSEQLSKLVSNQAAAATLLPKITIASTFGAAAAI